MERARNHVLEGCGSLLPQDDKYSQKTNKPEPVLSPSDMEAFLDHRPAVSVVDEVLVVPNVDFILADRCLGFEKC
jgi:hypothetical protein